MDRHVVDGLQRYLGDFDTWREQLLVGYTCDREWLEREVARARDDLAEQERRCERHEIAIGLAESESEIAAATRAAARAQDELARRRTRLDAAERALADVPTEAPADAMLDFYNELAEAIRGRLARADTLARINDALRDLFRGFVLASPPHALGDEGVMVVPVLLPGSASPWTPRLEPAGRHPAAPGAARGMPGV